MSNTGKMANNASEKTCIKNVWKLIGMGSANDENTGGISMRQRRSWVFCFLFLAKEAIVSCRISPDSFEASS